MGRSFTEEYAEKHNASRREKYRTDPEYRDRALKRARVFAEPDMEYRDDMLLRAKNVKKFGKVREVVVWPTKEERKLLVLTMDDVADAFDRKKFVLIRWQDEGKFPSSKISCAG